MIASQLKEKSNSEIVNDEPSWILKDYVIDEAEFNMMKDGVIIANAARGGVVNEVALVKAIESGKVILVNLAPAGILCFIYLTLMAIRWHALFRYPFGFHLMA